MEAEMAKYLFEVSYRVSGGFGGSDILSTLRRGEFARLSREALDSPVRRSVFNEDVLTLHVAVFAQSVADRRPRRTNSR
jgi:hypothetical protein